MTRKRIEDYAEGAWCEAADRCQDCGAVYQVWLEDIDPQDQSATARIRCQHGEACGDTAADAGLEEAYQDAGWDWRPEGEAVELLGVRYPCYAWALDVMPCLCCWKLIVGVPLLLFAGHRTLAFCWPCVTARGLGELMQP